MGARIGDYITDFQPPPYSEYWKYSGDVAIIEPEDERKELGRLRQATDSANHIADFLADSKVSPYYDSEPRQRCPTAKPEEGASAMFDQTRAKPGQRCLHSKDSTHSLNFNKNTFLRSLRKKHSCEHSKGSSSMLTPVPALKVTATPIAIHPPQLRNKIILSQDTISLFDQTGHSCLEPSPFKITLETTLLENRPYTICSNVLQRDQTLEAMLSNFEVLDVGTGYLLSEKPLPSQSCPTNIERGGRRKPKSKPQPSYHQGISRNTCTELAPHRPSYLTIISHPSPYKSSPELLFDGLRITDPTLLVGRRLAIRLRPSVALWSARGMGQVFGFEAEIAGWPDAYGLPLVLGGVDGRGEGERAGGDGEPVAEFRVVGEGSG